jgi:hypothetical protein
MAAFAVVAAAAGYAAATTLLPNDDGELIEDLAVIRQLDLLTQVSDVSFLQELAKQVSPDELMRDAAAFNAEMEAIRLISAASPEERERWVRDLPPDAKQSLWSQKERFLGDETRPREEQNRLKQLQQEIADDEKLQELLVAYGMWVSRKPEGDQSYLRDRSVPAAERVAHVRMLMTDEGRRVSEDEKKKLREEIRAIAEQYKEQMFDDSNFARAARNFDDITVAELRERLEKQSPNLLALVVVNWALLNEDTSQSVRERLEKQLDEPTLNYLKSLEREGRDRRALDRLRMWTLEAHPLRPNRDPQELMRFYAEDLETEQRSQFRDLSPAEFKAQVAQLYEAQQLIGPELRRFVSYFLLREGGGAGRGRGGGGEQGPRGGRGRGRGFLPDAMDGRGGPPPDFQEGGFGPPPERGQRGRDGRGRGGQNRGDGDRNRDNGGGRSEN